MTDPTKVYLPFPGHLNPLLSDLEAARDTAAALATQANPRPADPRVLAVIAMAFTAGAEIEAAAHLAPLAP